MKKLILGMVFVFASFTTMNANTNVEEKKVDEIEVVGDCIDMVYDILCRPGNEDMSVEGAQWLMYWMCEAE
jgi:hypothetical protein